MNNFQNTDNTFLSFNLSAPMLEALQRKGFEIPTSVQALALPRLLADSGHLIVKARTGTGKTAAFGIPLVEYLTSGGRAPRALILTPTRELALQVSREISSIVPRHQGASGLFPRVTAVYGGASIRNQILDLKRGTEIVVGTPGRIMDLMDRKVLDFSVLDWFILDEADEMLDMGFFEDVEKILNHIKSGEGERALRIALFSATMPEAILKVFRDHIGSAEILEDTAPVDEKPLVDQFYMLLKKEDRLEALRRIIDQAEDFYGLVFCATKVETDELARRLVEGGYPAEAIHGDLSQEARERTLRRFRSRLTTILVATDVAARGLDIERLTHVVNWDIPNDRDSYVHRIGRTGRAGRRGKAISLALPGDRKRMDHFSRSMEKILGSNIQWTKIPPVKSVMKAIKSRIRLSVLNAAAAFAPADVPEHDEHTGETEIINPDSSPLGGEIPGDVSPIISQLSRELSERLGAEEAVTVLLSMAYGEQLDSSRYGTITEIPEPSSRTPPGNRPQMRSQMRPHLRGQKIAGKGAFKRGGRRLESRSRGLENGSTRVYVGLGRSHGASARDVASLLGRAGGVPGRFVDDIEMKEFCAFASLPAEAASRACAFSRKTPKDPVIRLASPKR